MIDEDQPRLARIAVGWVQKHVLVQFRINIRTGPPGPLVSLNAFALGAVHVRPNSRRRA